MIRENGNLHHVSLDLDESVEVERRSFPTLRLRIAYDKEEGRRPGWEILAREWCETGGDTGYHGEWLRVAFIAHRPKTGEGAALTAVIAQHVAALAELLQRTGG